MKVYGDLARIKKNVGCIQHPMVERSDGRWMSDSTPIILQLEKEHTERSVLPENPILHFIALLIEDYADEWLWRAAMHYRWSYDHDRELLSRILADELSGHLKLPRLVRRHIIKRRQHRGFVLNDGVTDSTWNHVESGYRNILGTMSTILSNRSFMLGDSPSIADFGLMGPMLRHFGQDPTPAEIMRGEAPKVFDWLSRMWNAREHVQNPSFITELSDDLKPLLQEVCETHLVQLAENAHAYHRDESKFDMTVQDCMYKSLPVSRYRVYCLEQLRSEFLKLNSVEQESIKSFLPIDYADLIWISTIKAESDYDREKIAPFNKAINVFKDGVPA